MADNHSSNFVKILREIADELKLEIRDYSSDWAFRLSNGKKQVYIVGYQFPLNSSTAREICQDKALASEILTDMGIPNVVHTFLPAPEIAGYMDTEDPEEVFRRIILTSPYAVVKDNYGTGGHRVYRVRTLPEFREVMSQLMERTRAACISPYYEIDEEYRIVLLQGKPMLTLRKERASVTGDGQRSVKELIPEELRDKSYIRDMEQELLLYVPAEGEKVRLNWKHNLGQGAEGVRVTDPKLLKKLHPLAKRAAEAVNADFLSVDVIRADGKYLVLEMNGGVMMEHFSGQNEECRKIAKRIYKKAVRLLLTG